MTAEVANTAPFDAARAATDDDEPADTLTDRLAACIDRWVWTRSGPHDAAVRVLAEPDLADALRARDVVAQLAELHRPRVWNGGIATVCAHCDRAWPCRTAELLDGAVT